MMTAVSHNLRARSAALSVALEQRLDGLLKGWLLLAGLASTARIVLSPIGPGHLDLATVAPYYLLVLAPVVSTLLALGWFDPHHRLAQPKTRLAVVGRWRVLDRSEARRHPQYGAQGLMVSLLVGMLLNVPVRAAEYFAAMPPVMSGAPHWLTVLRMAMTLDVVLFTSLYMIAFVAALRRVPLFPRLLVAIWCADLAMQVGIADMVARQEGLPVLVAGALKGLLIGNVKKVLISAAIWSPYLLMSERVNVTYRHRASA